MEQKSITDRTNYNISDNGVNKLLINTSPHKAPVLY